MKHTIPTHNTEPCLRSLADRAEEYVIGNPVHAVAAAFCAGFLIHLLPVKSLAKPVAVLTVKMLPSALLGLGVITALDLCRPRDRSLGDGESLADPQGPISR